MVALAVDKPWLPTGSLTLAGLPQWLGVLPSSITEADGGQQQAQDGKAQT